MNHKERNARMDRILASIAQVSDDPIMWTHGSSDRGASLHDSDGDLITILPGNLVRVLDDISDIALGVILQGIVTCVTDARKFAAQNGARAGRERAIAQFHELLGIDRIVAAIDELTPSK